MSFIRGIKIKLFYLGGGKMKENITVPLQIILVKRWAENSWIQRTIAKFIGFPIDIKVSMPNILNELIYVKTK